MTPQPPAPVVAVPDAQHLALATLASSGLGALLPAIAREAEEIADRCVRMGDDVNADDWFRIQEIVDDLMLAIEEIG